MPSIFLLEPHVTYKQRHLSDKLLQRKHSSSFSIDDVKTSIRSSRNRTQTRLIVYAKELVHRLSKRTCGKVILAQDAQKAAEIVKEISRGTPIAVGKSAVVAKEVKPALQEMGLNVVDTYFSQFKTFENRFNKPWQLPELDYATILDMFRRKENIGIRRNRHINDHGCKDFTGVLGVNAAAADDGTVILLQHMRNISNIFDEAKRVILVIALDKIVESAEDAMLMTQSMALFGCRMLPLAVRGEDSDETGFSDSILKITNERSAEEIHFILIDNGRTGLVNTEYQDLLACIGCRACMVCPSIPRQPNTPGWSPKEYLFYYLIGKNPTLEHCLQCQSCRTACPLEIDLPGMILQARSKSHGRSVEKVQKQILSNLPTFAKLGSHLSNLTNTLSKIPILRKVGDRVLDISKDRVLPEIGSTTLEKWYRNKTKDRLK
jgi:L-lactate dehydrogenase complex protein LldF